MEYEKFKSLFDKGVLVLLTNEITAIAKPQHGMIYADPEYFSLKCLVPKYKNKIDTIAEQSYEEILASFGDNFKTDMYGVISGEGKTGNGIKHYCEICLAGIDLKKDLEKFANEVWWA